MSADVMPETRKQVLAGIICDFLMKPFNEQQLIDTLRRHLERHAHKLRSAVRAS
jgi:FixJ family two-component response regulator